MVDIQDAKKRAVSDVMKWPTNKLEVQYKTVQK
jgi:hypothetical protein